MERIRLEDVQTGIQIKRATTTVNEVRHEIANTNASNTTKMRSPAQQYTRYFLTVQNIGYILKMYSYFKFIYTYEYTFNRPRLTIFRKLLLYLSLLKL